MPSHDWGLVALLFAAPIALTYALTRLLDEREANRQRAADDRYWATLMHSVTSARRDIDDDRAAARRRHPSAREARA